MKKKENHQFKVQANRRKALRVPLIVARAKLEGGRKSFFGYAKNISRGGMFIGTVNPLGSGAKVQVEFTLPDAAKTVVQCTCEVVWQRAFSPAARGQPGMGLRFLDLPEPVATAIEAWVESGQS